MKVSNISRLPQVVPIIFENGRRTTINVMPKSRPDLPPGSKVDPNWMALNPGCIVLLTPEAKPGDTPKKNAREVESKAKES